MNNVSECGLFQDFLIVGPKPNTSVSTISITDKTGCLTTSQRKRENKASTKNNTSKMVILFSPYLRQRKKINMHTAETAKVIHAPTPAPPSPEVPK